jgi:hypothetical protein
MTSWPEADELASGRQSTRNRREPGHVALSLPNIDLMRMAKVPGKVDGVVVVGEEVRVNLADDPRFVVQFNSVRRHLRGPFWL